MQGNFRNATNRTLLALSQSVGIVNAPYCAPLEHHLVLGQSPGFVGEDVLDLAQILCDVEGSALGPPIWLGVVEIFILRDEEYLADFDDFNGHVQWERYHDLEIE